MTRLPLLALLALPLAAQDAGWVRDWEAAQKERPPSIASIGRIAPEGEPGSPMVIRGVVTRDGKPAAGEIVFAYQTDRTGIYNSPGMRGWRLKGWARSDANGRFTFETIRPGSYPGTRNPAHIHFAIGREFVDEIQFADDPLARKGAAGVLPVTVRNGVQYVDYAIDL